MKNENTPIESKENAQNNKQKGSKDQNKEKPVDVATLEKPAAISPTTRKSSEPVAIGEASS